MAFANHAKLMKDGMENNAHVQLGILKLMEPAVHVIKIHIIQEEIALVTSDFMEMLKKNVINAIVLAENALVLNKINAQCALM